MKNSLRALSCLSMLAALQSYGQQVEISLGGEYKLHGELVSQDAKTLFLRHESIAEPLGIDMQKVNSIIVNEYTAVESEYHDKLFLTGVADSSIPCTITEINESKVTFKCPFTPNGSLDRVDVMGVSLNLQLFEPLWQGEMAFSASEYVPSDNFININPNRNEPDREQFAHSIAPQKKGADIVYTLGEHEYCFTKDLKLNIRGFDFSTQVTLKDEKTVKDKNKPIAAFIFGDRMSNSFINNENVRYNIMLRLYQDKWDICTFNHRSWLTPHVVSTGSLKLSSSPTKIKLLIRHKDNDRRATDNTELFIDNKPAVKISVPINHNSFENKGFFGMASMNNGILEAISPEVVNLLDATRNKITQREKEDILESTEQEEIPGKLISYSNKSGLASFMIGKDEKPTQIPAAYIDTLILARKSSDLPKTPPSFSSCTMMMKDGNSWKGEVDGIKNGKVRLRHYLLGEMDVPVQLISRMDFYKQKQPTRATP